MNRLYRNFVQIKKQLLQRVSFLNTYDMFLLVIICLGVILRLVQYLFNRSLWLDESALALNIINRSFSQLLQPLDYNQGAPIGFLMVEKLLIQSFGSSEYILRLFPFLCGVFSLFLFCKVAKHYIKQKAALIAILLFTISNPLIYYSSECKQYSSDVFIALILYAVTIYTQSKRLTTSRIALFGIIGAITIWFSHPAVFILAGVGSSLILYYLNKKEWLKISRLSIIYSIWVLSFITFYLVSLSNLTQNKPLLRYWKGGFMPFPFKIQWFSKTFIEIFKFPVGLSLLPHIAALIFVIGCISMLLKKGRDIITLMSPIFFTLLASGFHKYPFSGRLLLFIVPIVIIIIAEGIEHIRVENYNYSTIIVIILISLLVFDPLIDSSYHFLKPYTKEEIKPVLSYIKENKQSGDLIYLYYASRVAFKYYSESYSFKDSDYIVGVSSRGKLQNYISDLDKLRDNKRVWVLFSHVFMGVVNEEEFFLQYLNNIGTKLDSFKTYGASVYLYDLREKK